MKGAVTGVFSYSGRFIAEALLARGRSGSIAARTREQLRIEFLAFHRQAVSYHRL